MRWHDLRNTKRAARFPAQISQLSQNLVDGVDVPLSLTRAELATLCEEELGKIRGLVRGCLEEAGTEAVGALAGAQAFGGGCRMPIVQDAVRDEVRRTERLRLVAGWPTGSGSVVRRRGCEDVFRLCYPCGFWLYAAALPLSVLLPLSAGLLIFRFF